MSATPPNRDLWAAWLLGALAVAWLGCFVYLGLASRLPEIPGLTGRGESIALSGHFLATFILSILSYALIRSLNLHGSTVPVAITAAVFATLAGGAIELLQAFSRTRTPQVVDLLFDGLGAVAGTGLIAVIDAKVQLRPRLIRGVNQLGVATLVAAIAAFLIWPPISPENVTRFCPAEVNEDDVPESPIEAGAGKRAQDGLTVLYAFEGPQTRTVDDVSRLSPSLDLALQGDVTLLHPGLRILGSDGIAVSEGPATKVYEAATESEAFTVEAWVRPDRLLQRGPARIVTMSRNYSLTGVNFHLGQERTCLSVRVDAGGQQAEWLVVEDVFVEPQPAWHLVVTYDNGAVSVFVDGMLVDEVAFEPGSLGGWDASLPLLIGNEATLNRPFKGDTFMVALYDRALLPAEVAQNHEAGPVIR